MAISVPTRTAEERKPWLRVAPGASKKLAPSNAKAVAPVARRERDALQRVRLTWYSPLQDDLMKTLGTERTRTYTASVAMYRYLDMLRRRLPRAYRLHVWSNPLGGSGTLDVWITRR